MLRIFRHIRKRLIEHLPADQAGNKVRTYLLYGIGEILLVVIGILIALQVNNWNEERKNKFKMINYTHSLISDLVKDSVAISVNLDFVERETALYHKFLISNLYHEPTE